MKKMLARRYCRLLTLAISLAMIITASVPLFAFANDDEDETVYHNYTIVWHANTPTRELYDYWDDEKDEEIYSDTVTRNYSVEDGDYIWTYDDYRVKRPEEYDTYRDGLSLVGWAKTPTGNPFAGDSARLDTSELVENGTTHLYAIWERNDYYYVTYDSGSNGYINRTYKWEKGNKVYTYKTKTMESVYMNQEDKYKTIEPYDLIPSPKDPNAMIFQGWYYDAALTSRIPAGEITVKSDMTIYAKFISKDSADQAVAYKAEADKANSDLAAYKASVQYDKDVASAKKLVVKGLKASPKKKSMKVQWKKNKKASGYQIQYTTDKKFKKGIKKAVVKKGTKTSCVVKKLKKGKKYYVRIRPFKKIKNPAGATKTIYGKWTKPVVTKGKIK